jgi:hypothetical protein
MIQKPKPYEYAPADCDVPDKAALEAFRAKRTDWLLRLRYDEHHAISTGISLMLWNDASFRTISHMADLNAEGPLHNQLVMEALINGHFATQTLAIRRLMDDPKSGVISLVNLLKDIAKNIHLFTRENYVSFDGLPFDYGPAEQRGTEALLKAGRPMWIATSGPDAWDTSRRVHEMFDRLSGVPADKRNRTDRVPKVHIETLQKWLEESGADAIVQWTHNYLAHAADPQSRSRHDQEAIQPNLRKLTGISRSFVRVTEALLAYILYDSGHGSVMPTPQYDIFEHLDRPVLAPEQTEKAGKFWGTLSDERDGYLEGVLDELVKG